MPYEPARDDADGFVCDGEWISRSGPSSVAEQQWQAMEEWQDELDSRTPVVPVEKVELDGLHWGNVRWWRLRKRKLEQDREEE